MQVVHLRPVSNHDPLVFASLNVGITIMYKIADSELKILLPLKSFLRTLIGQVLEVIEHCLDKHTRDIDKA